MSPIPRPSSRANRSRSERSPIPLVAQKRGAAGFSQRFSGNSTCGIPVTVEHPRSSPPGLRESAYRSPAHEDLDEFQAALREDDQVRSRSRDEAAELALESEDPCGALARHRQYIGDTRDSGTD